MSKRQNHLYEFGRFTLDPARRLLLRGGEPVLLQPKTFDTLLLLIERRGEVLEKEELIGRLWPDTFVEESNLSQNVYVLRKALGRDEGGSEYIRTVPKRGYQFVANVQERSDAPQEEGSRPCAATGEAEINAAAGDAVTERAAGDTTRAAEALGPGGSGRLTRPALIAAALAVGLSIGAYLWLTGRARQAETAAAVTIKSLVVLPLENLSKDPERDYFADGMTDALITALAKIGTFRIAHAGLANAILFPIASTGRGARLAAKEAATRALELDPSLAEAHTSLAQIKFLGDWDWAGAEKEFRRGIELNPSYVTAHCWYGVYLATFGRMREAAAEFEHARQLDPLSEVANWHVAWGSFVAGDYTRAIEQWRNTLELAPNFARAAVWMGSAYEKLGNKREAIAYYEKARQLGSEVEPMTARAAVVAGNPEQALKAAQELSANGGTDESGSVRLAPYSVIAGIYASLGEKELAFASLEKAYAERAGGLVFIKVYPWYKSLRSDPRFDDLARRVGLP
jgi:DNA-binding winged helix-turn-helix (wHTH) protein/Flp pilus assembly protein TadD